MISQLSGRSIVVTGGTSGIGLAAIKSLSASGAVVIGVGRSKSRIQNALDEIHAETPGAQVRYVLADLASEEQVRTLAKSIRELLESQGFSKLDALVNNAGVYLEKKRMTEDNIEMTFAVNHLAPFILSNMLLSLLQKSGNGRILNVSSYSHYTTPLNLKRIANPHPYLGLLAYKRSKLCNVLFTYALNERYREITSFAVDPGLVNTDIASKGGWGISHWVWRFRREQGTPADVPVRTIVYLISENQIDLSRGYYFKDSQPKLPSVKARKKDLADQLWALSTKLTNTGKA